MVCRDAVDRLSAFVDDELDPVTSREVSQHVESCENCAAALASQRELGETLRRDLEYHRAPDLLRARLMRELGASERHEVAPARRVVPAWRWLSAAAALVLVAGGSWELATLRGGNQALAREVASSHIRSLMADHLADVPSTDQHTVKPWFSGKLDFSPPVTDFASAQYPLIGGRLDYLQGHPVAALVYMHRKHVINVFVWPESGAHETMAPAVIERGYHLIHAEHSGMDYWVVSDLNASELAEFARMLVPPTGRP